MLQITETSRILSRYTFFISNQLINNKLWDVESLSKFQAPLLAIDIIKESIVDFPKTVEELDYDIFYSHTNSCCIPFFSLIKNFSLAKFFDLSKSSYVKSRE